MVEVVVMGSIVGFGLVVASGRFASVAVALTLIVESVVP